MEEVKIIPTQYGRGVAANRSWKEGEIIRISECIYLPDNQMPLKSQGSALWAYVFSADKEGVLVSLDWTSLMNHSEDNFNVEYRPTDDNKVIFKAARDINPGDELLINYGYDVVEHNKHFGIDTDKLNEDTLQGFDMSASQGGVGLSSVKIFSKRNDGEELIKDLQNLKDQLFDASDDVKESFNQVVKYFAVRPMLGIFALFQVNTDKDGTVIGNPRLIRYDRAMRASDLPIPNDGKKYYWKKVCDNTIKRYTSKIG